MFRFRVRKSLAWLMFVAAVPSIIAMTLRVMTGMTDTIMVGRMIGVEALAAVGYANIVLSAALTLFSFNHGAMAIMGRYHGAQNRQGFRLVALHTISINIAISIFVILVLHFSLGSIASLYGFEDEVRENFISYSKIVSYSVIPMGIAFSGGFIFRSLGNTMISMNLTIVTVVLNIVLNYVFIVGWWLFPEMGVNGVALSTLISRSMSAFIFFYLLFVSRSSLRLSFFGDFHFSPRLFLQIGKYGTPTATTDMFTEGSAVVVSFMVATLGTSSIALVPILASMKGFSAMPSFGFALVASVFISHALGAGNRQRVRDVLRVSIVMITTWSIITMAVLLLFQRQLVGIFTADAGLVVLATSPLVLLALNQFFVNYLILMRNVVTGAGNTFIVMVVNIVRQWFLVLPMMFLFLYVFHMGLSSLYLAELLAFGLVSLFYTVYLWRGHWVREIT